MSSGVSLSAEISLFCCLNMNSVTGKAWEAARCSCNPDLPEDCSWHGQYWCLDGFSTISPVLFSPLLMMITLNNDTITRSLAKKGSAHVLLSRAMPRCPWVIFGHTSIDLGPELTTLAHET